MIRIAEESDSGELLDIYAYYVERTAITFEYEVPSIKEFRGRIQKILRRYPYLVSERDGRIAGYAYAGPFKERRAYDWSVETTDLHSKRCQRTGDRKRTLYGAGVCSDASECDQSECLCRVP